jgi:hypothetical protein
VRAAVLALVVAFVASFADPSLRVDGTRFVDRDRRPFAWRGITAFRLVEQVASGREADADTYLAWCDSHDITVVRVLTMAKHPFVLPPDKGIAALPKLLSLAAKHDLQVEIVALADTASYQLDVEKHVAAIGQACATAGNCVIEIANEPNHPTQAAQVHDRAYLGRLRTLIPKDIPVALGAGDSPEESGGGDYATIHTSRDTGNGGWAYVKAIAALKGLPERLKMPVVSDEPIGAGNTLEPGRRDNDPARFEAAARATREAGLGGTFHYSDGINAVIPTGRQLACFDAWRRGMTSSPR